MKYGIDISSYQRNIDYNKVIKNINFAILRVGFGVNYLPESQKITNLKIIIKVYMVRYLLEDIIMPMQMQLEKVKKKQKIV